MRILLPALTIAALLWAAACSEIETYDPQPKVEFLKVYLADTVNALDSEIKLQRIHLDVIDGDGNLGLSRSDSTGIFSPDSVGYKNLYIAIFSKKADGSYERLDDLSQNMGYRIPYKEPIGQNKHMKAEVIVTAETPIQDIRYDTIRYEIFVYDRLMNKSNVATSCDIPLSLHGTIWSDGHAELIEEEPDSQAQSKQHYL